MSDLILNSREIFEKALKDFKPNAVVLMFSGGDDSLTTYHVAKELNINLDLVIHGNTRTGIEQSTSFVRNTVARMGDIYYEADAGDAYVDYIMRKGFFGHGSMAHNFSYNILKLNHFKKAVSRVLRKRQRNFKVLFLNGARRMESERRKKTMVSPYRFTEAFKNNIWVNLINEWEKVDCKNYLEGNGISRNPVSINLCRSGECMCGTMQSKGDRQEANFFYPEWGKWLNDLEKKAIELHGFGWGESSPKPKTLKCSLFQPMCVGCTNNI